MSMGKPGPEPGRPSSAQAIPGVVTIRCREDGPLVVELPTDGEAAAAIRVTDHLGGEFPLPTGKPLVALCRCGQSGTRPFCDGTHKTCGFRAAERARADVRDVAFPDRQNPPAGP